MDLDLNAPVQHSSPHSSRSNATLFHSGHKKILILGSKGSGKSGIIDRSIYNQYQDSYRQTLGADFFVKQQETDNQQIIPLHIWCCAGHERYRLMLEQFYKGVDLALLTFDVTSSTSYEEVVFWYNEMRRAAPDALLYLVGTKKDILDASTTKGQDGQKLADQWKIPYTLVSSKNNVEIPNLFKSMANALCSNATPIKQASHSFMYNSYCIILME